MDIGFQRRILACLFLLTAHILDQASTQTLVETNTGLATNTTTEGNVVYTCKEHEHECGDGTCVTPEHTCDGVDDCSDASDESNCTDYDYECTDGFACDEGVCLDDSQICDGTVDCSDGTDEFNCPSVATTTTEATTTPVPTTIPAGCSDDQFQCAVLDNVYECIPRILVCNEAPDCTNGLDEEECDGGGVSETTPTDDYPDYYGDCYEDEFLCQDGSCISLNYTCDGTPDCGDADDEENCEDTSTKPQSCTSTEYKCASGQCIDVAYLCNGVENCDDGSDEVNCAVTMSTIVMKILNHTGTTLSGSTEGCIYKEEWYAPGTDIVDEKCNGVLCTTDSRIREWSDPTCAAFLSAKSNNALLTLLALFVMLINWR